MSKTRVLAALVVLVALSAPASAQDYPNRLIKMLQGFPPGGNVDAASFAGSVGSYSMIGGLECAKARLLQIVLGR